MKNKILRPSSKQQQLRTGETYSPEVLMQMAPEHRENQVVVPKVME